MPSHDATPLCDLCASLAADALRIYCETQRTRRLHLVGERRTNGAWDIVAVAFEGEHISPNPIPWSLSQNDLADWMQRQLSNELLAVASDATKPGGQVQMALFDRRIAYQRRCRPANLQGS